MIGLLSLGATLSLDVTRGDTFELSVGLPAGWDTVRADPSSYEGRLVFRAAQDDALPDIVSVTSLLDETESDAYPGADLQIDFTLTPEQTQSLPAWTHSAFCEIRSRDGLFVVRLFDVRVAPVD